MQSIFGENYNIIASEFSEEQNDPSSPEEPLQPLEDVIRQKP